jgi:hypothetical protein
VKEIIKLRGTKALVKTILEEDQKARNSDSYLYLKVIEHIAEKKQLPLSNITILHFLLHMKDYGFPPFESVRRARQKLQAAFPELAASKEVADQRADNEEAYREFAREGVCC